MGARWSQSKSDRDPPPQIPDAAYKLSLSRYLQIHTCARSAKSMHLYALWYENYEQNKSRDQNWQKIAAEELSNHFRHFLTDIGAKEFTEREIKLYEEVRRYNSIVRSYHNRQITSRSSRSMTNHDI